MPGNHKYVEGFDRVFQLVGGQGRFQWLLLIIVSIQEITLSLHHVGYVFLGAVPDHWCDIAELSDSSWTLAQIKNISIPALNTDAAVQSWDKCHQYDLNYTSLKNVANFDEAYLSVDYTSATKIPCRQWSYDQSIYESTTATQFDLVCNQSYLVATIQATYMCGVFVGSLVLGALSDSVLGRRKTILISTLLVIIFGFAASYATSYSAFVIFRFFIAIGAAGSFQNCYTLLMEYSGTSSRGKLGLIVQVPYALGYMLMALFGYLIRTWDELQFYFSVSTLILIFYYWLIPDSARWLATSGKHEQAYTLLTSVAKVNRKPVPSRLELMAILQESSGKQTLSLTKQNAGNSQQEQKPIQQALCERFKVICKSYLSLIRTPELRRRSIIIWILYMTVCFVYFGITFDSVLLTNDPFLLIFLGGVIEIPGCLGVVPFASTWGRRPTIASTFLITGTSLVALTFIPPESGALLITTAMIGRLFISGGFAVIYLLATELYPTSSRATGLGSAALMGRFGSILAPYVVVHGKSVYPQLPSLIFGIASIVAGMITLLLPETMNTDMFENAEDLEADATTKQSAIEYLQALFSRRKMIKENGNTQPRS